jgi:F-type H+-transporting ATPase subunit b
VFKTLKLTLGLYMASTMSAWASGHGESNQEINWWSLGSAYSERPAMGWYIVTFIVFLAGLVYFVRKPLGLYLETRSKDIRAAIEEATLAKLEADKRLKEYEQRLTQLDDDIVRMKAEFKRQGEIEKAQLQQNAERMAQQIAKDAEDMVAAEIRHAMVTLKKDVAEQVILAASNEIKARVGKQMDFNMRDAFARDVGDLKH